jgi:hypothetical protein
MADTENLETPAPRGGTRESALRPAESDLHPADPTDDLTGSTPTGAGATSVDAAGTAVEDETGWPVEDAAVGDHLGSELPDTARPTDGGSEQDGRVAPGGSVEQGRSTETPDALRTAEYGRESAQAAADTSDAAPTPTETPPD